MTTPPKLTREQQLAEWRKKQKKQSQQKLKTWGTRVQKDFLKMRLRFWGGLLMAIGLLTLAVNAVFNLQGKNPVRTTLFASWGLVLVVVGILDLVKVSPVMLILTGIMAILQGLLVLFSGNLPIGAAIIVAGVFMLRDASRAIQREQKRQTEEQQDPSQPEADRAQIRHPVNCSGLQGKHVPVAPRTGPAEQWCPCDSQDRPLP